MWNKIRYAIGYCAVVAILIAAVFNLYVGSGFQWVGNKMEIFSKWLADEAVRLDRKCDDWRRD